LENDDQISIDTSADWAAAVAEVEAAGGGAEEEVEETSEETEEESTEETSEEASDGEEDEEDDEEEESEESDEDPEEESEETPEKVAVDKELATLKKLAEKHGFVLNDKGITKRDVAAFTDKKRRLNQKFVKERTELIQDYNARVAQVDQVRAPFEAFNKALQENDLDELAKIAGFEGWNELQADRLKTMNDPNYQRMRALEKERNEEKAAREREKQEHERRLQQQEQQRALQEYHINLSRKAAASKDPLAKAMHDDPLFIKTIVSLQKDLIDPLTRKTVSIEQALDYELPNGKTLRTNLEERYKRLHGVFGTKGQPIVTDDASKLKGSSKKKLVEEDDEDEEEKPVVKKKKQKVTKESKQRSDDENETDLIRMFAKQMDAELKKKR
jgi:hypothetical protein